MRGPSEIQALRIEELASVFQIKLLCPLRVPHARVHPCVALLQVVSLEVDVFGFRVQGGRNKRGDRRAAGLLGFPYWREAVVFAN